MPTTKSQPAKASKPRKGRKGSSKPAQAKPVTANDSLPEEPVTPAPEGEAEAAAPAEAPAEQLEAPADQAAQAAESQDQPEAAPAAPAAEAPPAPIAEAPADPVDQVEQAQPKADTAEAGASLPVMERVNIGQARGLMTMQHPYDVLARLDEGFQSRVMNERTLPTTSALHEEVRRSEGRCAPIIFLFTEDGRHLHPFAHTSTLAAALNLGLEQVAVLLVPFGDAGEVQTQVANGHFSKEPTPAALEDDDLLWRAIAHHEGN